ncbi:hypothetical protein HK098_007556 [Nowakowskiella sp. JEL0407]|nr:hypothetical protein HK098_007556 [Nowakowskiella sp. JEL0407]
MHSHQDQTIRRIALVGIPSVAFLILAVELTVSVLDLNGYKLGTPYKDWIEKDLFCEDLRLDSNVYQPVNAWSAFTYNLIGLLALYIVPSPTLYQHNYIYTTPAFRYLFYALYVYLGLASFYFHASFTYLSGILDFSSISFLSSFFVAFSITRWCNRGSTLFFTCFGIVATTSVVLRVVPELYLGYDSTIPVISVLIGGSFLSETLRQIRIRNVGVRKMIHDFGNNLQTPVPIPPSTLESGSTTYDTITLKKYTDSREDVYIEDWRWLGQAVISMMFAVLFWVLDLQKNVCFPRQPFQLHALWHGLTSYAGIFLFFYANMFTIGEELTFY